jgi:hypothetical protein
METYDLGYATQSSGVANSRIFFARAVGRGSFSALQHCWVFIYYYLVWKLAVGLAVAVAVQEERRA